MLITIIPEQESIRTAHAAGNCLLVCLSCNGRRAAVGLQTAFPNHAALMAAQSRQEDLEHCFLLVIDAHSCHWKFRTPPAYRGIRDRSDQIRQYHRDGLRHIQTLLHQLDFDVTVEIPQRFQRELTEAAYITAPHPPELEALLHSGKPFAIFWQFTEHPTQRLPDCDDDLLELLRQLHYGGCREDGYFEDDRICAGMFRWFAVHYITAGHFLDRFAPAMQRLAETYEVPAMLLAENGVVRLWDGRGTCLATWEAAAFRMGQAECRIWQQLFQRTPCPAERRVRRRTVWCGTHAYPSELRAADVKLQRLLGIHTKETAQ